MSINQKILEPMSIKNLICLSTLLFFFLFVFAPLNSPLYAADPPTKGQEGDPFSSAVKEENRKTAPSITQDKISGGSTAARAPFVDIKIERAKGENSYTVAEIFAKNKELNGKRVRVQGKVVKYNPAIMGKNWIHIQDGSGDPMQDTHDLVATSGAEATVGEVITVEGILAAAKDFGAGYMYKAIIEEAKLTK
jgi:hypothetical protein